MNYGMMRVASASLKLKVANPSYNKEEIKNVIDIAVNADVRLLVTPELSVTGYTCADLFFTKTLQQEAENALNEKNIEHNHAVKDITYENTQARERTQILFDMANNLNCLLVGTGDLSELAMGWCTYNGDHMSMYNVNASVPKTLVKYLVKYVADISDDNTRAILLDILDTPVSPELLPPDENGKISQKTEDNIGPYELHDFFLYNFIRFGFTREKLQKLAEKAFDGIYDSNTIYIWLGVFIKRFFISQFKRSCIPDSPKVGSVSLSPRGDWRMPSDAAFEDFLI